MRQRKGISYPQMGVFVQPGPRGHHMPTARHALRMTHQGSRVKVSGRRTMLTAASAMMATRVPPRKHGPLVIVRP